MAEHLCGIQEVDGSIPLSGSIRGKMKSYDKYYASKRRTKTLGEIINFIEQLSKKLWHALR